MDLLQHVPDVLTVTEAASTLKLGRSMMYTLIRTGKIRCVRVGRKILIPSAYLREFIERSSNT